VKSALDLTFVDETIARMGRKPDAVIPILQAMQEHYGYLPEEAMRRVCDQTEITPASLVGVSTFYDIFRHQPAGKHIVRVCRGTACHVTGADRVEQALRRQWRIPAGQDTDPQRQFTIETVACLGCCTLAPVVRVGESTFGNVSAERAPFVVSEFLARQEGAGRNSTEQLPETRRSPAEIRVGLGSCCMAKGSDRLFHALQEAVQQAGVDVAVKRVGCVGMCHRTPLIEVASAGKASVLYSGLDVDSARQMVFRHFRVRGLAQRAKRWWIRTLDTILTGEDEQTVDRVALDTKQPEVGAFLGRQVHIATENFGKADPLDLDEYMANGGFQALARCLKIPSDKEHCLASASAIPLRAIPEQPDTFCPSKERPGVREREQLSPEQIIFLIEQSGLRGRGGAGFPTGPKWRVARAQAGAIKYVICNGDEGDPGAFMDRMVLESYPYRVIEGLAIAAIAVGAHDGVFYIRHEYPLAVKRVRVAIKLLQKRGWLGERLLGANYPFRVTIKEGAGAFVCGEETALMASVEGKRGMPRLRPPFPAQQGLWDKPTVINNVETLAMIPWILRNGAEMFAQLGTATSKGTKVFALAGNIQRGGLIEIPMGTTIREIVEEIGGGVTPGRRFKAVQIGGPSGGCIPARLAETPVDFESLRAVGAIMGSGGLIVLDDTACMVDIARYFLQFTQDQSCGKCTFCRIGTRRMLDILDRLCAGKGQKTDLENLEQLSHQVSAGSLCGLGKTAPNPVLTTLRYFRDEYEAHIQGRCPAGRCAPLIKYRVLDNCTGCTLCAQKCPVNAIPMTPYDKHEINLDLCTRCDTCRQVCPHDAIEVK
jgi:NADH:ubiquinone oxidoreductase subunit F (NADH-binding)/NADH:ubiquinone oxidoreductase subunit E/Pyruvate/2-oxoacid:ferredoxin oxidoreductase delta subunit